jgi:hypothetical protein
MITMKSQLLLVFFIHATWSLHSQSVEIELDNLKTLLESGKINSTTYTERRRDFESIVAQRGGYPKLPYDPQTETFNFKFVSTFSGISQSVIHKRVKE